MKLLAFAMIAALAGASLAYDFCSPCCTVVSYIQNEQQREEPAEQAALDQACSELVHKEHLPDFLIKVCDSAVNYALKDLTTEFDQMSDTAICRKVGICSSSESCPSRIPQAFAVKPSGGLCQVCTLLKNAIDSGTVQQVCAFLERLSPQVQQLCDKIISNKGTEDQILAECEKDFCQGNQPAAAAAPSQCATIQQIEADLNMLPQLCQQAGLGRACALIQPLVSYLDKQLNAMAAKMGCSSSGVLPPSRISLDSATPCSIVKTIQEALDEIPALCKEVEPGNPICDTIQSVVDAIDGILKEIEGVLCQQSFAGVLMQAGSGNLCQMITTLEGVCTTLDNLCKQNPSMQGCAQVEQLLPEVEAGLQYLQNMLGCSGGKPVSVVDVLAGMDVCSVCHDIDQIIKSGELDQLCQEANLGSTCQLLKEAENGVEQVLPVVERLAHCSGARAGPSVCPLLKEIDAAVESKQFLQYCSELQMSVEACKTFQQIIDEELKAQIQANC